MRIKEKQIPLIVAHRGASYIAPENSIPAFELAFIEDADFIEGDFWLTNDNEIVCIHDADTSRVTSGLNKLDIRSSSLKEIKKADIGIWKGESFKGATVPTLQEIFQIIPKEKGIFIEIKDYREPFIQRLSKIFDASGISSDRVRIISFDGKTVQLAKAYFPSVKAYWLFESSVSGTDSVNSSVQRRIEKTLRAMKCDGIDVNCAPYLDAQLAAVLADMKMDLSVYDVNRADDAERVSDLGVHSITTDSPLELRMKLINNSHS